MSSQDGYFKYVGQRPDFSNAGRPLAPGQILRLHGEDDGPEAEGNARLIEADLLLPVDPEHLLLQGAAIFDAVDREGLDLRDPLAEEDAAPKTKARRGASDKATTAATSQELN